ncbi:hypothetical protein TIFTF001_055263 [Ficus carica]|uniref:Uncharacterized protein n=1 Tax=Ficus carica TaxID=3494 RepID=A0AA88JG26_FICCA|nr:hypothetical protein TIFTF001_055260 [Ficus carica]GMN72628.1 hypothetical protein TIFTF001_055261 [Ficus carica]GMN72631.1 hypothetical protein TIFTF001_055262 [Ficus carica]GMN72635.1 hypothetical protein TIFTF001_055263 [Ficus carica]
MKPWRFSRGEESQNWSWREWQLLNENVIEQGGSSASPSPKVLEAPSQLSNS